MACDNANACCYNKGTNPKPRNFCRGILAPPGGFAGVSCPPGRLCWCFLGAPLGGFAGASWPSALCRGLLPELPGHPRWLCQGFLASCRGCLAWLFLAGLCRCILALLPVHPGPRWLCRGVLALLSLLFPAFARRPKPGNTMVAILLINSLCGSKGNGPFLTKPWPKPFC